MRGRVPLGSAAPANPMDARESRILKSGERPINLIQPPVSRLATSTAEIAAAMASFLKIYRVPVERMILTPQR